MKFWDVVRADLQANADHSNLRRLVTAYLFNPGFSTIFLHRIATRLYQGRLRRLGIIIWRWNIGRVGCHLHLESIIGPGLCLPHPVGIVIGSGSRIGAGTTIYQTVTIGKKSNSAIYPSVGDQVTIYPNAVIIGSINIGDGAIVGASSVVVKDVPPDGIVAGNPAKLLRLVTDPPE